MEIISILISIVCGFCTWYYATKKKRLLKKIEEHSKKIETIENYSSGVGYKIILRDSFHVFSYALSMCLLIVGIRTIIPFFIQTTWLELFLRYIAASIYIASGILLFQLFLDLSKTFKPNRSIKEHTEKQNKLKEEIDKT